jgi:hypothetical protein
MGHLLPGGHPFGKKLLLFYGVEAQWEIGGLGSSHTTPFGAAVPARHPTRPNGHYGAPLRASMGRQSQFLGYAGRSTRG